MNEANTNLKDIIREDINNPWTFTELFPMIRDSIKSLSFMHLNKLIHRDIKPANILKFGDTYYISDYGLCVNLFFEAKYKNTDFF